MWRISCSEYGLIEATFHTLDAAEARLSRIFRDQRVNPSHCQGDHAIIEIKEPDREN